MKIKVNAVIQYLIAIPVFLLIACGFTIIQNKVTTLVMIVILELFVVLIINKKLKFNLKNIIAFLFLFYMFLNMTVITADISQETFKWYFFPLMLAVLYVVIEVSTKTTITVFKFVTVAAVVESATIFLSVFIYNFITRYLGFLYSSSIKHSIRNELDRDIYSGYMGEKAVAAYLLNLGIAYTLSKYCGNPKENKKYLILTFVFVVALLFTGKRVLLLIAIGMIVFSLLLNKKFKYVVRGIIVIALFAVVIYFTVKFIPEARITLERFMNRDEFDSVNGREHMWKMAIDMFKSKPIFGYGYGSYQYVTKCIYEAHNSYLQLAAELGITGLVILSVIVIFSFVKSIINLIKNNTTVNYLIVNIEILTLLYAITGNVFHTYSQIIPYILVVSMIYQHDYYSETNNNISKNFKSKLNNLMMNKKNM